MIGVVLGLGFLLLLIALQAPLLAAVGVLTNLLATGAAFGVAKWIFQDGALHSLLGFQSQGFLDAWGPVFFFAMIFAISMDYTVFLLSAAKEHWDHTHDPREAMVGGVAHSGRVIFAAGAVMVAVFFTFALSGPLPPKEMGIILGVAVLLDAALIRLLLLPVLLRLMGKLGLVPAALGAPGAPRRHLRTRMSKEEVSHVSTNARAVADGMVPGLAPGTPAPDRARPHLHRPPGPGRSAKPEPSSRTPPAPATIPVLVADGEIVRGEQAILAYLERALHRAAGRRRAARQGGQGKAKGTGGSMSQVDSSYTLSTTTELAFADAVARVREELAAEGFGVLCEIDVQATLKKKLGRRPRALPDPRRVQPAAGARGARGRARARRCCSRATSSSTSRRDRRTSPPSTPSRCSRSSATTSSPRPRARCDGA